MPLMAVRSDDGGRLGVIGVVWLFAEEALTSLGAAGAASEPDFMYQNAATAAAPTPINTATTISESHSNN